MGGFAPKSQGSNSDIRSKNRALQLDLRAANAALATMTINFKQAVSAQENLTKEKEVRYDTNSTFGFLNALLSLN